MVTRSRLPIRVAPVQRGEITSTISTNGIVEPQENFEAHAPYAGLVKAVYIHEGDRVPQGKLLVAMDDTEARTRLATALAGLRGAQAALDTLTKGGNQQERYTMAGDVGRTRAEEEQAERQLATLKKLALQGSASPSEVAAAQQRVDQAEASLRLLNQRSQSPYANVDLEHAQASVLDARSSYDAAQQTLREANVRSPFAGTVYSLPVSTTEFVSQGDHLLQMANLARVQVRAYFDEPEIGRLTQGQPIRIVWDALPGHAWAGHISRVPSTVINLAPRHVGAAIVTVDDADGKLLPATNVTVTVTTSSLGGVLEIPREALHSAGGVDFVYLLEGEKLRRVPVKVGVNNLTSIQIVSGLQEGQTVAAGTTNGQPIVDGVPVRIVH